MTAIPIRAPSPRPERWWTSPLIWVTLAAGLGGTAAVWKLTVAREQAVRSAAFTERARSVEAALQGRLWAFEQLLRGASALFYASSEVTADEWQAFSRRVEVLTGSPGFASLGFIERQVGRRPGPDRFVVEFLESSHEGLAVERGTDLAPNPVVRQAMEHARALNDMALSGSLDTVNPHGHGVVLAVYPVYRRGREGVADGLTGFVFGEFHLGDMIAALPMALGAGVRLEIADQAGDSTSALLFSAGPPAARPELVAFSRADRTPVYGRIWNLDFQVERGRGVGHASRVPRFVLLGGLLVTGLATGLAASEVGRHRLARQQARTMGTALESTSEALVHEVAEQQLTQEALRQSEARVRAVEARTRSIVNAAMDGIILLDGEGRIQLANPAAERLFVVRSADVVGRSYAQFVPERYLEWYVKELELFRTGAVRERILGASQSAWVRRSTGEEFPVEATVSAVNIEGVRFSVVVLRDVSERQQAERQRSELERQLRQAQKLEAVGTLAGGIAHDFNNILGAILGHVELAALELPPGHPARDSLDQVGRASLRARDLVRHILTFSRHQEQQRAPVSLPDIVGEALRFLRAGLPASVDLAVENRAGQGGVLADATQIHQVVINLCTNAAHAIGERGGRLSVALDDVTLDAEGVSGNPDLRPGRYIRLGVRDDGAGMTREVLDRIYEPFFTTKPHGEGTGLGLAVVHGIVRAHDGAILAESTPGVGSCFQVFLPAVDSAPLPAAVVPPAPVRGNGERIMVVDDEPSLASVLSRMATRLGYRVQSYTDPAAALRAFGADPDGVDLLVTDLTMPGLGGHELAERARLIRPGLPILFSSGYLDRTAHPTSDLAQPHEFVAKPITLQVFGAALQRLVAGIGRTARDQPAGV